MRYGFPIFLALLLHLGTVPSTASAELMPDRLLPYKTVDGIELKLHVFEPVDLKPSDRRAAIVFFFGGGWKSGDPKQFYPQAKALADHGMLAFSAEYRVKSRHQTTPCECVKDGKSAIRWVRQHAAELGVDPERIVAAGGSAGGHVAACTGVIAGFEETGEDTQISSIPNGMVLFNPVLDTTERGYGEKNFKPAQKAELSPCHHIGKSVAPTIIFHGTADKTVPFENAERFESLMKAAGNDCVVVAFAGKDHGFFNSSRFRPQNGESDYELTMDRTLDFLVQHGFLKTKNLETKQ